MPELAEIVDFLTDTVQSACNACTGPGQVQKGELFGVAGCGGQGECCPFRSQDARCFARWACFTRYRPGYQR